MEQVIVYEKVTTWLRHVIGVEEVDSHKEALNKVIECYKENNDPWDEDNMYILDSREETEVEEPMTVEENGGCSTIEIVNRDGQVVWDNA